MVNNNRTSNRRRGNRRTNRTGRLKRVVNRTTLGMRIIPSLDPPEYAAGPWWPLTLVDIAKGDVDYTPKKIHQGILTMLDLTGYTKGATTELNFKFRVLSVRAWGLAKQPIQLAVTETHSNTSNWVKEINDFGTPLGYSRVGWRFGDIFVHRVFDYTEAQSLFQVAESGSTDKILVYIQVLIRVPNAPDPSLGRSITWSSNVNPPDTEFEHLSMNTMT